MVAPTMRPEPSHALTDMTGAMSNAPWRRPGGASTIHNVTVGGVMSPATLARGNMDAIREIAPPRSAEPPAPVYSTHSPKAMSR